MPVARVSRVVLSHWHADHSGGIAAFLRLRRDAAAAGADAGSCVVDLHPDRPIARGIAPGGKILCRLPPDPTFAELEELGAVVEASREGHAVAGGTVYVSGEIPRVVEFEKGLIGGVRWLPQEETNEYGWTSEEVGLCSPSRPRDLVLNPIVVAHHGRAVCCD